jgi:hypothetical protein
LKPIHALIQVLDLLLAEVPVGPRPLPAQRPLGLAYVR